MVTVLFTSACTNLSDRLAPKANAPKETRVVRGKVLDINGNPIAEARVQEFLLTSNKTGQLTAETKSSVDGTFELNAPANDGTQRLYWTASKPGLSIDTITGSGAPKLLRLVLGQAGTISGIVKDAKGNPIPGANVEPTYFVQGRGSTAHETYLSIIPGLGTTLGTTTDASGKFKLENLPVGADARFQVAAEGFATYKWVNSSRTVPVANLDIVLERMTRWVSIKGTLRHEKTGAPGVGVQITVRRVGSGLGISSYSEQARLGLNEGETTTDTNGAFVFERLQPGDYAVDFYSPGDFEGACIPLHTNKVEIPKATQPLSSTVELIKLPADISVPADGPLELNLKWTDGVAVSGRIVDSEAGKPVPLVYVSGIGEGSSIHTRTDTNGVFKMHAYPGNFSMTIQAGHRYQYTRKTGIVLAGVSTNFGDIVLSNLPINQILVVDEAGKPVPNATIYRQLLVGALAITDAQGRAQLTDSLDRPTELYPWYEVRSEDHELAGYFFYPKKDRTNVTWAVRKCSTLTGELRTPEGAPAVGVTIYLERTTKAPEKHDITYGERTIKTDAQGRFKIDELVPSMEYRVVVSGDGKEEKFQSCQPFHRVLNESGTNIVLEPITLVRKSAPNPEKRPK